MAIKNPFNFSDKYENPNRNTFDVSYQNNVTFNLGEIIPIQCKEVLPNTTVSFDTTLGLSFMPLIFPVQTRMRAEVKSFYVRNRTLWRDWQDFIGKTKDDLVPPYLASSEKIKTGSLSDYLGLSTTLFGSRLISQSQTAVSFAYQPVRIGSNQAQFTYNIGDTLIQDAITPIFDDSVSQFTTDHSYMLSLFNRIRSAYLNKQDSVSPDNMELLSKSKFPVVNDDVIQIKPVSIVSNEFKFTVQPNQLSSSSTQDVVLAAIYFDGLLFSRDSDSIPLFSHSSPDTYPESFMIRYKDLTGNIQVINLPFSVDASNNYSISWSSSFNPNMFTEIIDCIAKVSVKLNDYWSIVGEQTDVAKLNNVSPIANNSIRKSTYLGPTDGLPIDISHDGFIGPYYDKDMNPDGEKITCLAHRAYESIYNYWYRDSRNNPRIVNGQPEYNKFITTDEGGEDNTDYHIFHDNWEQDFLTTAVQSPQQGIAPLVGITSYGEFQFKDDDGNIYSAQAQFAEDGDTITGFGVLSPDMPQGNKRQLVNLATYGISISDLRNVNALQRWLEINMRRGLRYQDQIKSHFGVDTKYKDYMYPEFIGGHNEEIYIKEVDQTVPTSETPLGWKAGQATSFGQSRNRVTHFCDEHGFIITCIVVKPVANYSQLVPKHFYKKDTLDYYFPEFGHLSMQPIPYREVAPIQAVNEFGLSKLNETFGYQRAWYEYFNATDEIHGLFRTNLRNFVVQRQFTSLPELGNDFLTVNHEELDDIFAVSSDDVNHKIIGQIYFDYKIKLPIPKYGIPRLEA